jgi:hypothetical protein
METLPNRQVEYSIGDIIEWLLPLNKPAISTITNICTEIDGSVHYMVETYEAEEDKILKETYTRDLLDHMFYPFIGHRMAIHYPVVK